MWVYVYLLHIHSSAMIPSMAPIMSKSDTTTPATAPPVVLLLLFFPLSLLGVVEAVGLLVVDDVNGCITPKVIASMLLLVKGPVPTEFTAAILISYCVDCFNPVISNILVLLLTRPVFNSLYLIT